MPERLFERSSEDRVVAGVCGGIAARLAVDATLVRLVFAILALAGGSGVLVYLALWIYARRGRALPAAVLIAVAAAAILYALGLSTTAVLGAALLVAGSVTVLARGGSLRPGGSLPRIGVAMLIAGAVIFLGHRGASGSFIAPGAVTGALVLIVGPWLWQLTSERADRIRLQERADVASRIHDSVLQTLALIQRDPADARRVATLARRQERELRTWLYPDREPAAEGTLAEAVQTAAAEIEELHGLRVEVVRTGDAPLDERTRVLVLAAREAMANAAKHSGADEVSVFLEAAPGRVGLYVRDRGAGFDPEAGAADRRGISESIRGRMERVGGTATIVSAPGEGTDVELELS
jgi:signal transduction histidine kinase